VVKNKVYHKRVFFIFPLFRNHQEPIEKNRTPSVLEDTRVLILVHHRIQSADSQTRFHLKVEVLKKKQVYVLHNRVIFYDRYRRHVDHTQEDSIEPHWNQNDENKTETDDFQHVHGLPRSLRYKSRRFDWETASEGVWKIGDTSRPVLGGQTNNEPS